MAVIFDPELSIKDNWKAAYPLNDAWYLCALDDLKSQYQNAGSNDALTASLIVMMQKDLHYRIGNDEFLAIGIQVEPEHTLEPKIISNILFGSDSAQIDFEQSKLNALNFEFMDVRICKTHDCLAEKPIPQKEPVKQAGRTSTYDKSKLILKELFQLEANRSKSSAMLHPDFEIEFEKQFPRSEWGIAIPAERTLRNHLKRYRQELAEIGSGNSAI